MLLKCTLVKSSYSPAEMAGKAASMDSRDPAPSLLRYETREKENVYILQAAPIIKFGISA